MREPSTNLDLVASLPDVEQLVLSPNDARVIFRSILKINDKESLVEEVVRQVYNKGKHPTFGDGLDYIAQVDGVHYHITDGDIMAVATLGKQE